MLFPTLLFLTVSAADAGTSSPDAGYDPKQPTTWRLSAKLTPKSPEREALLEALTRTGRDGGAGEVALTRAEAEALLADPRAEPIYGEKTVSIVAPSMVKRHRQEHLDMMARFLQPERVQAGAQFLKDKAAALAATEARTGVDREVIIGILMWESKLGTITGDWVAFNALASQAFFVDEANAVALEREAEKPAPVPKGTPPSKEQLAKEAAAKAEAERVQRRRVENIRQRARRNLVVLARQCKARGIDVFTMKGSWAGALGFPQFMPASLRWAEDGNGDGVIDLFQMDDAIASVGRYLASAGFKKSRRDAVYDYNHEEAYVQGVLAFADALAALRLPDGGVGAPQPSDAGVTRPDGGGALR